MADYSQNFKIAMTGMNGLGTITEEDTVTASAPPVTEGELSGGDPKKGTPESAKAVNAGQGTQGPLRQQLDFRDIVTGLIANNVTDLTTSDARADMAGLKGILGPEKARQVMNAIIIHNKTNAQKPMNERILSFYDTTAQDPEIDKFIKSAKGLGEGVINGLNTSPYKSNIIASGRDVPTEVVSTEEQQARLSKIRKIAGTVSK